MLSLVALLASVHHHADSQLKLVAAKRKTRPLLQLGLHMPKQVVSQGKVDLVKHGLPCLGGMLG